MLAAYNRAIVGTDKLPAGDVEPVLFGLYGEVGSVLTVVKKREREGVALRAVDEMFADGVGVLFGLYGEVGSVLTVVKKREREGVALRAVDEMFAEELADVLWYFATLSRRLGADLDQLFLGDSEKEDGTGQGDATVRLGEAAAALLRVRTLDGEAWRKLRSFGDRYRRVVEAADLKLEDIVSLGVRKARDGFVLPDHSSLPRFDVGFPEGERLPEDFAITFVQRSDGKCEMVWDGATLGDPLNDAIVSPDGFRFHDVFHLAHVAVLHWSPTFRSLAGRKRKSAPDIDDTEDGARARVVEEGIVAWIFGRARQMNFFEDQTLLPFDLLKTIGQFVQGFEVERCPLRLWERAILMGCDVFRRVCDDEGGVVVGDRERRMLAYEPVDGGG
ncbi:hypothetical protein [Candidatus Palauibacter sp.]|uniref:hypothetical protein n=1 Tax=Candidatus Palauibacter sp. TaxID=3101350 RepID=UPI003B016154